MNLSVRLAALAGVAISAGLTVLALLALAGPSPFVPDALSAWFVLLVACAAIPALLAAEELDRAQAVAFGGFLAAMVVTLLAPDLFTMLAGFEAMSLASWAVIAAGGRARAARLYLGFALFSGLCLLGAVALLAGAGPVAFADLRATPPEGWRAIAVLVLVLAGAGAKAGLLPFHIWLPLAHPAAPTPLSALMSAAMVKVALYVMLRFLLDLCGPAQPAWWGAPLLALGGLTALWGAIRANIATDLKEVLACSTLENVGLLVLGLGLVLVFRGADLLPLAGLALAAVLLHAMVHAGAKTLLFLGLGVVARQAGTRDAARLGGLISPLPWVAAAMGLGAATLAALPPLAGFASEWLLLQALVQAWRVADTGLQMLAAVALAAAGLALALGAAAMLRLFGLVFLGRARSPRAAGASPPYGLPALSLALAAGWVWAMALLAAPLLGLARGVVAQLVGGVPPVTGLGFVLADTGAAYMPWAVAALLLGLGLLAVAAMRRLSPHVPARAPGWDGGFGAPPAHLPFGDPLTQPSAAGAGQPVRRMLGALPLRAGSPRDRGFLPLLLLARGRRAAARLADAPRGWRLQAYVRLSFGTLVALLALLAWLERPGG